MSVQVGIDELFQQIGQWGFGYLLTVSEDERPHLIALTPAVVDDELLRFDADGRRPCRNAAVRPKVAVVFPPHVEANGYSLIVDGDAEVNGQFVDVRPTGAVLHRPAPTV